MSPSRFSRGYPRRLPERGLCRSRRSIGAVEVRVTYDGLANAAYIYLVPIDPGGAATTVCGEDEAGSVNLDFDRDGRLIGIEVLNARENLPSEVLHPAEGP
jgi:uncharacterized protein YuzE